MTGGMLAGGLLAALPADAQTYDHHYTPRADQRYDNHRRAEERRIAEERRAHERYVEHREWVAAHWEHDRFGHRVWREGYWR
jgi:hypothetical protein